MDSVEKIQRKMFGISKRIQKSVDELAEAYKEMEEIYKIFSEVRNAKG